MTVFLLASIVIIETKMNSSHKFVLVNQIIAPLCCELSGPEHASFPNARLNSYFICFIYVVVNESSVKRNQQMLIKAIKSAR